MSVPAAVIPVSAIVSASADDISAVTAVSVVSSLSAVSVYLTSYIHEKQDFVTTYYGLLIPLFLTLEEE